MRTSRWLTIVALLSLVGIARAERSPIDPRKDAAEHAEKARVLFNVGRFEEAATEYQRAYEETASPDLLFNIAQCYRQAPNLAKAIFFYKSYLSNAPNADRADILQKIARLQQLSDEQARARPALSTPAPSSATAPTRSLSIETPPAPRPQPPIAARNEDQRGDVPAHLDESSIGRRKRAAGVALLTVGGALLIGGIVSSVIAVEATSDLRTATARNAAFDPSIETRGQSAVISESVLYAAAGVAALVGTTLYLVGRREQQRAPRASIEPSVGVHRAGLVVTGSF